MAPPTTELIKTSLPPHSKGTSSLLRALIRNSCPLKRYTSDRAYLHNRVPQSNVLRRTAPLLPTVSYDGSRHRSLRNGLTIRNARFFEQWQSFHYFPYATSTYANGIPLVRVPVSDAILCSAPLPTWDLPHAYGSRHSSSSRSLPRSPPLPHGYLPVRIFDETVAIFIIQRIPRLHILQLHRATDISGHQFFHLNTVGTRTNEQLRHAFFRPAGRHCSNHHLHVPCHSSPWVLPSPIWGSTPVLKK